MSAPQLRRTEAKAFFANERTFLHWMNMSVTIGSISAALLGVSAHAHKNWGTDYEGHAIFVRSVSLVLMVLSIFMAIYAAYNFHYRGEMLQAKMDGPYDSRVLPVLLASILMVALIIVFSGAIAQAAGWA
ncbi:g5293 [Coccomyxa viridis]|uniref:G5293 protein n=1 Tax=Coccomyxa viridis TaxID=1274662 RepID=A0ABP1FZ71_9CHLO